MMALRADSSKQSDSVICSNSRDAGAQSANSNRTSGLARKLSRFLHASANGRSQRDMSGASVTIKSITTLNTSDSSSRRFCRSCSGKHSCGHGPRPSPGAKCGTLEGKGSLECMILPASERITFGQLHRTERKTHSPPTTRQNS